MYLPAAHPMAAPIPQRRQFPRYKVQCRARILIGRRHYAGYLDDISEGGARLRTITPIRKLGEVMLRLPDLSPLRCQLRWIDAHHAGVSFALGLPAAELARWAQTRLLFDPAQPHGPDNCWIATTDWQPMIASSQP